MTTVSTRWISKFLRDTGDSEQGGIYPSETQTSIRHAWPGVRMVDSIVADAAVGSVFIYGPCIDVIGELKGLDTPLGVAVAQDGRIYVGNNGRDNVEVYNAGGVKIATLGQGTIKMPNDIALDRDGNVYVVDSLHDTVWVYDSGGAVLRSIGGSGDQQGQFRFPTTLAIGYFDNESGPQTGRIFVGDQGHATIHVFGLQGNFINTFGGRVSPGSMGMGWKWKGKFVRLQSLAVDGQGRLHAVDCYMNKVQILKADTGKYIASYGAQGKEVGQLNLPLDICITAAGQIVAANAENKRVETINPMP